MSKGHAAIAANTEIHTKKATDSHETLQNCLRSVRRFFIQRVQSSDVDDMVQNVALRIQSHVAEGRIDNPERYVFQVARSVMIDQHRRNVTHHAAHHETLEEWHHPVEEISPDRIVESAETLRQVMGALRLLPERTRQAFVLHRFEHFSYGEIAMHMGISVSAVEKHIMRAIRKLSIALDDD